MMLHGNMANEITSKDQGKSPNRRHEFHSRDDMREIEGSMSKFSYHHYYQNSFPLLKFPCQFRQNIHLVSDL